MCTCASCSYTDSFHDKGFATWPRGDPAGPRSSTAAYAAHVAHSRYGAIKGDHGQPFRLPGLVYPVKQAPKFVLDWINRRLEKPLPAETGAASPAQACKPAQHFPEPDRQPETADSIPPRYRVDYSANDTEDDMAARFMSVAQASKAWDISQPRIRQWLADGRIKGAQKVSRDWLIPANAERPKAAKPGGLRQASK